MSERRPDPEILAQRLDQVLPPGRKSIPSGTPDPVVNTAVLLARVSTPALEVQTSQRIEARMLAAFDAQYAPRLAVRSRRRAEPLLRWALVASLALVLLLVGLTPAVAASLPGEPLYSVKQFYEKVELAAAITPPAKAGVYLQHADRRAQEALTLLERKQFAPGLVSEALADMDAAGKLETEVRSSPRLRGQVLQVETALSFIVQDAAQSGIASQQEIAPLSAQIQQYGRSDLLLPLPPTTPEPTPVPIIVMTDTVEPTEQATETPTETPTPIPTTTEEKPLAEVTENPHPPQTPPGLVRTPTCQPQGNACNSQGVPGGQVIPPTHRPTNTPRNTPAPPDNNGSGGSNNGNGGGNGNGGKRQRRKRRQRRRQWQRRNGGNNGWRQWQRRRRQRRRQALSPRALFHVVTVRLTKPRTV